jgi:hypothetical protein
MSLFSLPLKTHSIAILLLLAASICFAQTRSSAAEKPVDLKALQDTYSKAIQKTEGDSASAAQSLPANYIKELQKLQQTAQKAGDLDGFTAANHELERFKTEQTVPDQPDASAPDALKKLQTQYKTAVAKNDLDKNRKIVSITKQYLENLTSLQTGLTKSGNVNEALSVNAEIKRVKDDSKFTSAQFALAAAETDKQPAVTDNQPSDKQPPADQAKKTVTAEKSDKTAKAKTTDNSGKPAAIDPDARIYDGKPFPDAGGLNYKNELLYGSDHINGAPKISITASLATENNMQKSSTSTYWGAVGRVKRGSMGYDIRLTLKSAVKTFSVDNPTLVVQYFSKDVVSTGKSNPKLIESKKVALPTIDSTRTVGVDLPPVSLKSESYRYNDAWYGTYGSSASGSELYGFIVSIFDSSGALVAQSGSNNTLKKLGVDQVP